MDKVGELHVVVGHGLAQRWPAMIPRGGVETKQREEEAKREERGKVWANFARLLGRGGGPGGLEASRRRGGALRVLCLHRSAWLGGEVDDNTSRVGWAGLGKLGHRPGRKVSCPFFFFYSFL